ncbi:hypothetical protein AK812_SmicGene2181 [Symbiodinium microadriaticum]|uniref:Uncharacterized protein n=1 Tax=Symbiodinium microadriaticum TaxID=2951 RepID=A0A1Q9F2E3_SYMMI|nr:hypothetical protein AK812_SmicGene2181 [Symbiodinium microadriaticum]
MPLVLAGDVCGVVEPSAENENASDRTLFAGLGLDVADVSAQEVSASLKMELPLDEIPEAKAEPKEQWQLACFHRSVSLASKAQKIPETEAQVLLNLVKAGAMEECASKVRIFMMEQEKKVKHADHFIT